MGSDRWLRGTLTLYANPFGADRLGEADNPVARIWLSLIVLFFFMLVNLEGVRSAGVTEDLIVYGKIVILGLFAVIGLARVDAGRLAPLFDYGAGGLFVGAAVIFVAYEGFQLITNAVRETANPDRNLPRGIYGSILITGIIYLLLAVVAVGTMSLSQIVTAREYALAEVAQPVLGNAGRVLIGLAALMATSSAINSTLFGASRMMAEMAARRMMPSQFNLWDRKGVPWLAIVVLTVLAALFTMLGSLSVIAEFSSMTFLLVSVGVSLANIKLRARTGANLRLAVLGLVLMLITVVTIVVYLALHNPDELFFILALYLAIAVAAVMSNRRFDQAPLAAS